MRVVLGRRVIIAHGCFHCSPTQIIDSAVTDHAATFAIATQGEYHQTVQDSAATRTESQHTEDEGIDQQYWMVDLSITSSIYYSYLKSISIHLRLLNSQSVLFGSRKTANWLELAKV